MVVNTSATAQISTSFFAENATKTTLTDNNQKASFLHITKQNLNSPKMKVVFLILFFFVFGLTIYRWYMGTEWYWNFLYLITFGWFFIGSLIDLVGLFNSADLLKSDYSSNDVF